MARLNEVYREAVVPEMMEHFSYDTVMQVPHLEKIVVNVGLGEALQNPKALDQVSRDLQAITGQRPVITRARKSIANYKVRQGDPIGEKVTLRGERMYSLLDRLVNVALPRQRDFRGVSPGSFDGRGNYTLGIDEQLIFVEVDYDQVDKARGMEFTFVTSAQTDEEGRYLLRALGMPFSDQGARD